MKKISIDQEFCKGCKLCVGVCHQHLIMVAENLNAAGYHPVELHDLDGRCTGCILCAIMCPESAIEFYDGAEGDE